MTAKFTKGEWIVHTMEPTIVIMPGGGFDIRNCPDSVANAHLIAAAPDMYKMLSMILLNNNIDEPIVDDDINALLKKARGE